MGVYVSDGWIGGCERPAGCVDPSPTCSASAAALEAGFMLDSPLPAFTAGHGIPLNIHLVSSLPAPLMGFIFSPKAQRVERASDTLFL